MATSALLVHCIASRNWYDMIYLLSTIWLTHGGSSTQYTFANKQYTEQHNEKRIYRVERT